MIDAVDNIIALGWEPFDIEEEERVIRLSFQFGEELNSVTEKIKNQIVKTNNRKK